jgi:serpin B
MLKAALFFTLLATAQTFAAESTGTAAKAINSLGIELLAKTSKPDQNALLSPYSIQSALAMTYAGADGVTRAEMMKALHYPTNDAELHGSFAALQRALDEVIQKSKASSEQAKQWGATHDPITLTVANRLFGQAGYDLRPTFLNLVKESYAAPFEPLDFIRDSASATKHINGWVENQTRQRIRNLIPDRALNDLTRLVLVNAIYLKAPWAESFSVGSTKPLPFRLAGGDRVDVPTMTHKHSFGYEARSGFSIVVVPYSDLDIQFVILLPDKTNGLPALEAKLTPALLADCTQLNKHELILFLPKFKLEPPMIPLSKELESLGMSSAFDKPPGSANFNRIAPRRPNDYLYISEVFHKTFLSLDEKGTEAAAATAALAFRTWGTDREVSEPIEVRMDRPFLFAIQHRPSGACLFLGRVVDPR